MKFKCERDTLISALSRAGRAVTAKVGPVVGLSGVLLELTGDSLSVTGSDVDLTIADRVTVTGGENGAALVQARLLTDIVRSLDLGAVEVEFDEQGLKVRSGRSEFSLRTMPESDFPRIPLLGEATVTVDGQTLVGGLRQVVSAAGRDESRPVLTGVLLTPFGGGLRVVATDSYRLAQRDLDSVSMEVGDKGVLVPSRALEEVARLVVGDVRVGVQLDESTVLFEVGATRLSARLINGDFPSYEGLIPTDHPNRLVADRKTLLDAIRRVRLLALAQVPMRVSMTAGALTLSATAQDVGEATEEMAASYEGEDLVIAFNAQYLHDGVEALDGDEILLYTADKLKPALLRSPEREDFLYVLMPLRIT
ncbi:MAG: DNA polymerase III subunit beta [bacterium]|nr:DNA polymerase III subunit beta [bacterium]MXZ29772.1 DNA polymerase III subunit beta [Acidimicrobiia bacterium]MYB24898.1 DNA polymerase III subunit beta [Acidimicrobiia bacterium]MYJ13771.1 DNA polymerase III subunit beta [Acidimicrobiia bacterium]